MVEVESHGSHSISAYLQLIRSRPGWRILWIGEILSNLGNWLSYIATLLVVDDLSNGKGIYLSAVLVIHFLPSFGLFPIAGVVADRFDRTKVLIWSNVISAVAVGFLPLVRRSQELWLLYVLLFFEFSTSAFYDPARRALTPSLVPSNMLHLATTLDSFAWSFTAAFGASLGGLAASRIGPYACFILDSFTYVLATLCALRLRAIMAKEKHPQDGGSLELQESVLVSTPSKGDKFQTAAKDRAMSSELADLEGGGEIASESSALLGNVQDPTVIATNAADIERREGKAEEAPKGCLPLLLWSVKDELGDMKEGWRYACHAENRDVLAMSLLKAGGAAVWGAADILNVRFSELPEMQSWGNAAFTLGLFFGSVGVACVVGPILFNYFTPPKPKRLLLSCVLCYLFLWMGYLGIAVSRHIVPMCLSIMWKSFGSAVIWMYSTLLLQLRVPDNLLGRMLALEMAIFTVAESISGVFGGVALDNLGLTIRQTSLTMAALGLVLWVVWTLYLIKKWRGTSQDTASDRFYNS